MRNNVIRGLSSSTTFFFSFALSLTRHHFRKRKVIEQKMCILILCTTFVWNIPNSEMNWARYDYKCIGPLVLMHSTLYSCQILMTLEFWTDFRKDSNIKFHENLFSGGPCWSTRTDGRTDLTKLILVFRNFAKAPRNQLIQQHFFFLSNATTRPSWTSWSSLLGMAGM